MLPASADRQRLTPPPDSLLLGGLPFLVIAAGAVATIAAPRRAPRQLLVAWSGSILAFVAGVRRGLSFDDPGGAPARAILPSLVLWSSAFAGLALRPPRAALATLVPGFALLGLLDRAAARQGEAPRYFATLRPLQSAVAVASLLGACLAKHR